MGLLRAIIFFAALLHGSAAFACEGGTARVPADQGSAFGAALLNRSAVLPFEDPCSLASEEEIARVLGGAIVPVPVDQIGEETAPYCRWATAGRRREIKLTIWSEAELPVLNLTNAESYFVQLEAEARARPGFVYLDGFGARAFEAEGTIVVLKTGRVMVVDFVGVRSEHMRWLVGRLAAGL